MGDLNPLTGQPCHYQDLSPADMEALLPRVLPAGWFRRRRADGPIFDNPTMGLRVLISAGIEEDGQPWLHISCSRRDGRLPSWEALLLVRDVFVGSERFAYHVYPPRSEHYDVARAGILPPGTQAPEVMHLWVPLGVNPVPNFLRWRGGSL